MKQLFILALIWSALFLAIVLTDIISSLTSVVITTWVIHSIIVGVAIACAKVWNRKQQEPLLDINLTNLETSISVILAVLVAISGGALLQMDSNQSIFWHSWIAFVMAYSQFTLLKSVQPDPASPTHGFNRVISLSKPIYFILIAIILISCDAYVKSPAKNDNTDVRPSLVFYSFDIFDKNVIKTIGSICTTFILAFPIIFILGLLPQITTFIIYVLEQIDIHFFGSTAATLGLKSAAYSFLRSCSVVILLYLAAFQSIGNQKLFSLFCGLLISISYFLSRNSSDTTIAYRILRRIIRALNPPKQPRGPEKFELTEMGPPARVAADAVTVPLQNGSQDEETSSPNLSDSPTSADNVTSNDETEEAGPTVRISGEENENIEQNATGLADHNIIIIENNSESNTNTLDREEKDHDTESITTRIQSSIDDVVIMRLKKDLIKCLCATIVVFALHVTTIFTHYNDQIDKYFPFITTIWGLIFHFVVPHLRRDLPCMCVAKPVLRPREYNFFEVKTHAKLMWFEKVHYYAATIERNFIYPIFWLNCITRDATTIQDTFGHHVGPLILVITSLKLVRSSFNDPSPNYITIVFTQLFFNYDVMKQNYKIFTLNYFVFSILHLKIYELILKLHFIYIYIAPWQIPWGSAFHAVAQPAAAPHSALLFFQAILSSILSAPLQPIMGSAIFMMSYVRPIKFWERDYNTNVIDINSTRLVTQLEKNRIDSNRLDGIFYEHLTKCLQRKLCRDLALGRWGPVSQGDCFIMASDNLNCLVHIIELGNGVCTFQLRGLEFRGTYCQQQEVEAINEGVAQDDGFCCFEVGRLPYCLSVNAAFNQMWLGWHVTHNRYVLEGYSISDNPAGPMLQPFDLRKALITYYVKAIIYFTVTSPHLSKWLRKPEFHQALQHTKDKMYADLDPTFSLSLDLDFDLRLCGVTRAKFCSVYFDWIKYCFDRVISDKKEPQRAKAIVDMECTPDSFLVSLCYGLSLLARRSLSAASDGQQFHTVETLLFGLHALLKGDFRVTSLHDEWIFQEMRFFKLVVIPAVRMSLKLHLDHFAAPDDYEDNMALYEAIAGYQKNLVISHETDVAWRTAVLSGVPSLLTLRLYCDDGSNQYKFIMLNRRFLSFRIIKINRECVRGLWASQQQELIFFRNTDPERGSIQNAKQALRNMINSSCDQPVGYPIYVSPLTTSYVECGAMSSFIT